MTMPAKALDLLHHDVTVAESFIPSRGRNATIIGAHVTNEGPSKIWERMGELGEYLVYDCDDDYFSIDPRSEEAHAYWKSKATQKRMIENIQKSSAVVVCSERLKQVFGEYHDTVINVPNGLPASILNWDVPQGEGVTVGWAGSGQTFFEMDHIVPQLNRFFKRNPKVKFHLIGASVPYLRKSGLAYSDKIIVTGWVNGTIQYLDRIDFDIWLAPYENTEFNRAKMPTKALEAAFLGIPIIASNIEPYANFVQHGVTGFLVNHDYEWNRYLNQLVNDPELRASMAAAARKQATHYTIEALAPRWVKALTDRRAA